jgi:hypothetical protein
MCLKKTSKKCSHSRPRSLRAEQDIVFERFLYRRRAKGQEVNYQWIRDEMKRVFIERYPKKPQEYKKFAYSNGWLENFVNYYEISHQMQTEKKPVANTVHVPLLQSFHRDLCLIQQSEGANERDETFGRFSPKYIWNVDQIPDFSYTHHV